MGIIRKLKSTRGESLGEVLIAVLVAAIGITILTTMITTGSRITGANRTAIREYYAGNNAMELRTSDAESHVTSASGTVTVSGWNKGTETVSVNGYIHEAAGRKVVLYRAAGSD